MLGFLKNSKGEILKLFFQDTDKEYYLREIGKQLNQEPGAFQPAIKYLVEEGILKDERRANLRFFRLNKDYPLYEEVKSIVSKTVGIEAKLKTLVGNIAAISHAFIFGSIAKNQEASGSDIDLMIIGEEIDQDDLINKINRNEEELAREINYHIYTKKELARKLKEKNDFLVRIFKEPKIVLKGDINEFGKLN